MIVMGIDQSLTCTGICIYDTDHREILHTEAIHSYKTHEDIYHDVMYRCNNIADRVADISDDFHVDDIMLEGLSYGSSGSATRNLAMLFATICNALDLETPATVAPARLKKFASNNGRASKKEMLAAIEEHNYELFEQLTNTTIKAGKYDIADAYWLSQYYTENNL